MVTDPELSALRLYCEAPEQAQCVFNNENAAMYFFAETLGHWIGLKHQLSTHDIVSSSFLPFLYIF